LFLLCSSEDYTVVSRCPAVRVGAFAAVLGVSVEDTGAISPLGDPRARLLARPRLEGRKMNGNVAWKSELRLRRRWIVKGQSTVY
jgi:hypothetical protein